jgi:hypothetical protein
VKGAASIVLSRRRLATIVVAALALAGCSSTANAPDAPLPVVVPAAATAGAGSAPRSAPLSARALAVTPLCPAPSTALGSAQCTGLLRADVVANPTSVLPFASLPGLHPSDLLAAYGLTADVSRGGGQTIAVVVAYDDPLLPVDLAVYRAEFGLPDCSASNGCLSAVFAQGTRPAVVSSWAAEAELDVEMVSAICPNCKILVSEAASDRIGDLAAAAGAAVDAGATVVSNSYAIAEDPSLLQYDHFYAAPHVPMTAGAGDGGFGAMYPASSRHVTAVGGTTLTMNGGSVASETVWGSTGAGCSRIVAKPSWQHDPGCPMRTVNDVTVVGDPATGVAAFVTAFGGWTVFGGTSVGAPIVASMYALAGNQATVFGVGHLYDHRSQFHFITGASSTPCSPLYLCTAAERYSGVAGLGTPFGLQAF